MAWALPAAAVTICREPENLATSIAAVAAAAQLPTSWIRSVMRVESADRHCRGTRPLRSDRGAIGLMQLMPRTWQGLRQTYALGPSAADPDANLRGGALYLRELYGQYGVVGMFAAYNAGPQRYARYLRGGQLLPAETRNYLLKILETSPGVYGSVGAGMHRRPVVRQVRESLFFIDRQRSAVDLSADVTTTLLRTPPGK